MSAPHAHMKVAWFSPFPPQRSGISDFSVQVVYELAKHCEVHLWADTAIDESLRNDFTVVQYASGAESLRNLKEYDAVIYNMGNNAAFHGNIYGALMDNPGIVILHDYMLNGFYEKHFGPKAYRKKMFSLYGLRALQWRIADKYKFERFKFRADLDHPFNEEIVAHAEAVVVHSEFARERLLRKNPATTAVKMSLPASVSAACDPAGAHARESGEKYSIMHFGELREYKQVDKLIRALAEDRVLRKGCVLNIIGQVYPETKALEALVKESELNDSVRMLGYQPFDVVDEYLADADIFMGLRYPTMGESSSSLLRAMACGKACVVTDNGWYSELPEDCVAKVSAPVDVDELSLVLTRLMHDTGYRDTLSANAGEYARREHSVKRYVERLLELIRTGSLRR